MRDHAGRLPFMAMMDFNMPSIATGSSRNILNSPSAYTQIVHALASRPAGVWAGSSNNIRGR